MQISSTNCLLVHTSCSKVTKTPSWRSVRFDLAAVGSSRISAQGTSASYESGLTIASTLGRLAVRNGHAQPHVPRDDGHRCRVRHLRGVRHAANGGREERHPGGAPHPACPGRPVPWSFGEPAPDIMSTCTVADCRQHTCASHESLLLHTAAAYNGIDVRYHTCLASTGAASVRQQPC